VRIVQPDPLLDLRRLLPGSFLLAFLAGSSCSVMREVPREEFASAPARQRVRITSRDGRTLRLREVRFTADSLVGTPDVAAKGEDAPPPAQVGFALDEIAVLEQRQVDWFRTGLVAGAGAAGLVLYLLTRDEEETPPPAGGKPVP
jgi:hypothetical protein